MAVDPNQPLHDKEMTPHEAAMDFFRVHGWEPHQAAAIVGNLDHESAGLNPNIRENNGKGPGFGLAQWTDPSRVRGLMDYARSKGEKLPSFPTQLEYVQWELDNKPEFGAETLRKTASVEEATQVFSNLYERPGKPMMESRLKRAQNVISSMLGPSEVQAAEIPQNAQPPAQAPVSAPQPQSVDAQPQQERIADQTQPQQQDRAALLAEAYRRGILPPEIKANYEEAMRRGLVQGSAPIPQPTPQPEPEQPEPMDFSGMQGAGDVSQSKDFPKVARPVLEYGGLALGGPAGYAVGSMVANAMDEKVGNRPADLTAGGSPQQTPQYQDEPMDFSGMQYSTEVSQSSVGKEFAKDLAIGTTIKGVEKALPPIASKVAEKASSWATKLYESALKIPPSVPNNIRNKLIRTGIEGEYLPTQKGLQKLDYHIGSLNREIASTIEKAKNAGSTVDREAILARVDELKSFYQNAPNKSEYIEQLDSIKDVVRANWDTTIPADVAQKMKQTIYAIHRKHYGEMKTISVEADKAIARGIKEELVEQFPELATLNAKDSALISLESALERSVNRIRNYDIIKLGDSIMGVGGAAMGGPGGAIAAGFIKHAIEAPGMKSKLAFALNRASRARLDNLTRPAAYATGKIVDEVSD